MFLDCTGAAADGLGQGLVGNRRPVTGNVQERLDVYRESDREASGVAGQGRQGLVGYPIPAAGHGWRQGLHEGRCVACSEASASADTHADRLGGDSDQRPAASDFDPPCGAPPDRDMAAAVEHGDQSPHLFDDR